MNNEGDDEKEKKPVKRAKAPFRKSKTELTLQIEKKPPKQLSTLGKRHSQAFLGHAKRTPRPPPTAHSDNDVSDGEERVPMVDGSGVRPPPPGRPHRPITRQESTLSRGFKQMKELVRRKTEILVHGSEVDKVKPQESDDHFKQLTLRRMQTRGRLVSMMMGNVNKEKLEEKLNKGNTGWGKIRAGIQVSSQLRAMGMQSSLQGAAAAPPPPMQRKPTTDGEFETLPLQDPLGRGTKARDMHKFPSTLESETDATTLAPPDTSPHITRGMTQTSITPCSLNKESVAVMGWKAIKGAVKGVSVINTLLPTDHQHEHHDDVFDPTPHPSLPPSTAPTIIPKTDQPQPPKPDESEPDLGLIIRPDHHVEPQVETEPTTPMVPPSVPPVTVPPVMPSHRDIEDDPRRGKFGRIMSQVFNRQDKRYPGLGFVQRCMGRARKSRVDSRVKIQLDNWQDHRPFFTWWVSTVQVLVLIFALADNGFAEFGLETKEKQMTVQRRFSVFSEKIEEQTNFYFGPTDQTLIRLGAKYTPCMRKDKKLFKIIDCERRLENDTACCVNSANNCMQLSKADCSSNYHSFYSYENYAAEFADDYNSLYKPRQKGTVCGLDPLYCDETHLKWPNGKPLLDRNNNWLDDITQWPICTLKPDEMMKKTAGVPSNIVPHIKCKIIARPCCIGSEGQCVIVHGEYCKARGGVFHKDKALCSQVDCMESMCGMLPFMSKDEPNQMYRLWLSLFLHAGILHLCLSIFFQMVVLRDLEKLAGWWRIGLIYVLSGIVGNLGSAIFVPYRPDVGPSGACFGLIACLFVEFIQSWQLLDQPLFALAKLAVIAVFLFMFGLLPWVDNYAHLFGFISGILLSFALLPYIVFGEFDHGRKFYQAIVALIVWLIMTLTLICLFYRPEPIYVKGASVFTCIPPLGDTESFCKAHTHEPVRWGEFWETHNKSTCQAP